MRQYSFVILLITALIALPVLSGCATIRTMPSLGTYGSPKVFSGARLDLNAAAGDEAGLKKFSATAPDHPLLDLPFSALLDLFIIPITLSVAAYELVFE